MSEDNGGRVGSRGSSTPEVYWGEARDITTLPGPTYEILCGPGLVVKEYRPFIPALTLGHWSFSREIDPFCDSNFFEVKCVF